MPREPSGEPDFYLLQGKKKKKQKKKKQKNTKKPYTTSCDADEITIYSKNEPFVFLFQKTRNGLKKGQMRKAKAALLSPALGARSRTVLTTRTHCYGFKLPSA